ncbi:MAG: adenylate/guanylate cyclase domain-containing protein [Leptospiraceae bacterium]|nr:adenylate/guanylate cyclase domain-containing protein [Leptospiraceae bacterium]
MHALKSLHLNQDFECQPRHIDRRSQRSYALLNATALPGAAIHAILGISFHFQGAQIPAVANIISVSVWLVAYLMNRKGFIFSAYFLAGLEIMAHTAMCVYFFGLEPGFQYILLIIPIATFLQPPGRTLIKVSQAVLAILVLLFLTDWGRDIEQAYSISDTIAVYNRVLNILASGLMAILVSYHYSQAVNQSEEKLAMEYEKSERLLLNILPAQVADELKTKGATDPVTFESASVLFTDFQGFTRIAEKMSAADLVAELDRCFSYFDSLMERHNLEKLKTIGDSFMCAGGIPAANRSHAIDCVLAALEIQNFMNQMKEIKAKQNLPYWELRLGIHSGPLVAGVIGEKKFQYDVWGDTVNTASRCESAGAAGKINISGATYDQVREFFECTYRGKISTKHKGEIDMYFVEGIRPELTRNGDGKTPSAEFQQMLSRL